MPMKRLLAVLALGLAVCTIRADEGADMEEKAKRLMALVADLDSERPDVREDAATKLLATGGDAIPFVIDGVYRKNAKLHLQVLEKLVAQEKKGLPAELQLSDDDLKAVVKDRLGDTKQSSQVKTFLYLKYLEGVELFRKGHYEEAQAKAAAILELDPRIEFADAIRKLRIQCEEQLIQVGLVRTTATTLTPICADNSIAKVAFNATNLAAGNVEIWFGDPNQAGNPQVAAAVKAQATLHVEVSTQVCDADGGSSTETQSTEKPLDRYSVPLKTGETRRLFEMELPALSPGVKLVKLFVSAKMRVVQIDGPTPMVRERWLRFPAVEIKVVPGNIQAAGANALQNMCDALQAAQANSVFLYCIVMPEGDRPKAAAFLIEILKPGKWTDYDRLVARNCLSTLTGETFTNDEAWLKWHDDSKRTIATPPDGVKK
ncbi:MAG: hypothetical protein FD180_2488 [Planctomycetota bacterium]|nr:MAG: hypothetical protein FD180_2488 [Planctomycetota bacterium]